MTKLFSLAPAASSDALLGGLVKRDVLSRAARLLIAWQQRATLRYRLAQMDERELADMGLGRAAAMAEAAKPFWRA